MKAICVDNLVESSDALQVKEVPRPTLDQGQVLVEVHAVGTNFFDILMVQGKYQVKPPLPFIPGAELAGIVVQVHPTVEHLKPGDRVAAAIQYGAFAEWVAVRAQDCIPLPDALAFTTACTIPINYTTSYLGLKYRAELKRGEICLVHAAAGGVGIAAVQLAKWMGATVIATAGSEEKLRVAREHGADYVVNYRDADWPKRVRALTPKGRGVDVVYDPVGLLQPSLRCTAWSARLLVVGFAAGAIEKLPANRLLLNHTTVMGVYWGGHLQHYPQHARQILQELTQLIAEGQLQPVLYQPESFVGLDALPKALAAIAGRQSYGKVVVSLPVTGHQSHL